MAGDETLVIIPKAQYNNALAKIVLKPNFKTKHGKVLSVRSYGANKQRNMERTPSKSMECIRNATRC